MKPFSLLIKPASADCNLRCAYCFYLKNKALYPKEPCPRMSDAVLKRLVSGYLATDQPVYTFGWQGGEPTLMGEEFFRKVTGLQQEYGRPGAVVANGLQTNATLLDDNLATLLAEYKFLVGASLDGPPDIHDHYRKTATGGSTHARVLKGIDTLKRNGVEFNVLVLVNSKNVTRAKEVYQYLADRGHFYHQYIPCVEFDNAGNPLPFAIDGPAWGKFLCGLFDQWYPRDVGKVSIRLFDAILAKLVNGGDALCTMGRSCRKYFVVEYNGDIYPCDFFVDQKHKLGNVMEDRWEKLMASKAYKQFGAQKAQYHKVCNTCDFLSLCNGDCLKHRMVGSHPPGNLSVLCEGWRQFFGHAKSKFERLAQAIKQKPL